ncbi:hypothetical protein LPJ59_004708 [Coemansia sp. RSA 2399]|nr:hypothetical protein LPJ59_004708 [Coemansia sp. RSA 2399]KAJ1897658.1 hypothetical protein LPJ81_004494 [Coemansia sp. IMI 209127]
MFTTKLGMVKISRMKEIRTAPATVVAVACLAVAIDNIAYAISFACLPHVFEDMHLASESKVGLASTMFGVGSFITSILSGIVSDRIRSRKLPIIVGAIGYSLCGVILFFSSKLHHVLLYRLVNGLASGCTYPIATATVGDVYPNRLLGLQMALVNTFASVGYTIGPVLGGALYDSVGIRGVSAVLTQEPLKPGSFWDTSEKQSQINSIESSLDSAKSMPLWKLVFQWQVLSASMTTLSVGMLAGSLENVLPIYTKDRFKISASKTGLLFVVNGGIAIALSTPTGWIVDRLIRKHGERMRAYIELAGLVLIGGAIVLLGSSTSFAMITGAEIWFAAALLMVNVPVMSSFGDFVNALGLDSMAQSYGLYNSFWSLSSTIAPPIATTLYTQIGYKATVAGVLTGLCATCAALILAQPLWQLLRNAFKKKLDRFL